MTAALGGSKMTADQFASELIRALNLGRLSIAIGDAHKNSVLGTLVSATGGTGRQETGRTPKALNYAPVAKDAITFQRFEPSRVTPRTKAQKCIPFKSLNVHFRV